MVDLIIDAFVEENLYKVKRVEPLREFINVLSDNMKENHVSRLSLGQCELADGSSFHDILANIERLGAHCSNIAVAMNKLEVNGFQSHGYKLGKRDRDYIRYFNEYEKKYSIDSNPVTTRSEKSWD